MKILPLKDLTLVVVVTAITCTSFTLTSQLFVSAYGSLIHGLSGGEFIVWDRGARTPITGIIPVKVVEFLREAHGIEGLSPEVLSPCAVNGRLSVVRGVDVNLFSGFESFKLLEGRMLEPSDHHKAVLGARLMRRLNLRLGERVVVQSVLRDRWVMLDVVGVIATGSYMDDEIIVPMNVARWLRGINDRQLTLVRVRAKPGSQRLEGLKRTVTEGEVVKLRLTFPNGTEVRHVKVRVRNWLSAEALTDESGVAYLRLPPGRYVVEFYLRGRRFKETYELTVKGIVETHIELKPEFAAVEHSPPILRPTYVKEPFNPSKLSAGEAEEFLRRVFENELGLTEDALKLLSTLASFFILLLSYYTTHTAVYNGMQYIALLRALGSSKRKTLKIIAYNLFEASILGAALGLGLNVLAIYIINSLNITILGYSLIITLSPHIFTPASFTIVISNIAGGLKAAKDVLSKTITEALHPFTHH